jgi:hypothetical protein
MGVPPELVDPGPMGGRVEDHVGVVAGPVTQVAKDKMTPTTEGEQVARLELKIGPQVERLDVVGLQVGGGTTGRTV